MESHQFDVLARRWATRESRRTTLKVLAGLAVGSIFGTAARGEVVADDCKRVDKPCKKNSQCCAGLACAAGRCQDEATLRRCRIDDDCPGVLQRECGIINPDPAPKNQCLDGFCTVPSPPPEDPCCRCRQGGACDVSEGTCCLEEQVCEDKDGHEFCCPGEEYCGTDRNSEKACLSPNRTCTTDDTHKCFEGESCAAGVCCPGVRACGNECCDFNCACLDGTCACGLQAGIRRF